jgi:hypothetical protein
MDIAMVLARKYIGSEWTLEGEDYSGLTWISKTAKPTEKELSDLWALVQTEMAAEEQAKLDAKSSAIAKLKALGLTVQEVEVAFGLSE